MHFEAPSKVLSIPQSSAAVTVGLFVTPFVSFLIQTVRSETPLSRHRDKDRNLFQISYSLVDPLYLQDLSLLQKCKLNPLILPPVRRFLLSNGGLPGEEYRPRALVFSVSAKQHSEPLTFK